MDMIQGYLERLVFVERYQHSSVSRQPKGLSIFDY